MVASVAVSVSNSASVSDGSDSAFQDGLSALRCSFWCETLTSTLTFVVRFGEGGASLRGGMSRDCENETEVGVSESLKGILASVPDRFACVSPAFVRPVLRLNHSAVVSLTHHYR